MFEAIDLLLFVLPLLFSVVTLAAMHWFPWHNGTQQLGRVAAYTAGTIVTIGVPALTMLLAASFGLRYSEIFWAAFLVVNALVSGGTVRVAYWIDSRRALSLEDAHATRRN